VVAEALRLVHGSPYRRHRDPRSRDLIVNQTKYRYKYLYPAKTATFAGFGAYGQLPPPAMTSHWRFFSKAETDSVPIAFGVETDPYRGDQLFHDVGV